MSIEPLKRVVLTLVVASLGAATSAAEVPATEWHSPQSAPELALDRILKTADGDEALLDNILEGRGKNNFHPSVDYRSMLTPMLLSSIRKYEKLEVKKSCGGHYLPEVCGIDFSPINCAQDSNDTYLYSTKLGSDQSAIVSYTWPSANPSAVAIYRMTGGPGHWRIDGIVCADFGIKFNMP